MTRYSLWDSKFLLYLTGGVVTALVDIGIMQWLIALKVAPLLATSIGFLSGLCVNYAFHSRLTFKSAASSNGTLPRYLSVVALNYLLTLGMVTASLALFDQALAGKVLSLPVIAVIGYLLGKHWIFR